MESQFEKQYRLFEIDWWWFMGRHDLIYKIFSVLKSDNEKEKNKVLEIGCSSGENSKIFNNLIDYYGIDISLGAIKTGNENIKTLILGDAGFIPFKDKTFEMVLFLDVLEHLDEEKSAIDEAYRVLKDDGHLLILVPAFNFLWGGHDILNEHKRRYTRDRLIKVIDNKFYISKISYWNFFLFIPIVFMKIIKRFSNKQTSDFTKIPNKMNNIILVNLLKIENYIILKGMNLPIGVSILCVCRK